QGQEGPEDRKLCLVHTLAKRGCEYVDARREGAGRVVVLCQRHPVEAELIRQLIVLEAGVARAPGLFGFKLLARHRPARNGLSKRPIGHGAVEAELHILSPIARASPPELWAI